MGLSATGVGGLEIRPDDSQRRDRHRLPPAVSDEYGWRLREFCAVRTLFESAARISEVITLTAADCSLSEFLDQLSARNKGSVVLEPNGWSFLTVWLIFIDST